MKNFGEYNGNLMILKISPTLVNTLTADYVYRASGKNVSTVISLFSRFLFLIYAGYKIVPQKLPKDLNRSE